MTQAVLSNNPSRPSHASPSTLGLMSCVRESSPPLKSSTEDVVRHEPKWLRFRRGLRKIFGRKPRHGVADTSADSGAPADTSHESCSPGHDPMRSRSTSQISDNVDPSSLKNRGLHSTLLSLSHDSVFTAESGSEVDNSSSLSVQKTTAQSSVRAELLDVVRRRKLQQREDTSDDEDLGLPRSPLSTSPFNKVPMNKSYHSTSCSDGSLLSVGSSEVDEDSSGQRHNLASRNSSKVSLYEKKLTITHDSDVELSIGVTLPSISKLSHSAAKHKMAVRPKRTHGAPRRQKKPTSVVTLLPATPEVNEDISIRETLSEEEDDSLSSAIITSNSKVKSIEDLNRVGAPALLSESQMKSASLPAGSVPPTVNRLARSRSNATPNDAKSAPHDDILGDSGTKKDDGSFFSRLLSRRSGKKKKGESLPPLIPHKRMDEKGQYVVDVNNITCKQYPSSRQRIEPLNIPLEETPPLNRMHVSYVTSLPESDQMDAIEVAKPEPYLMRSSFAQQESEFKPVHKSFSFQPKDLMPSLETTPSLPTHLTMPEIHTIPEDKVTSECTDSKDVMVDETVIEDVIVKRPSSSLSNNSEENDHSLGHTIVISHKTDQSKPCVPQKPTACVIPVRPNARPSVPSPVSPSQVSMVFLNNEVDNVDQLAKCSELTDKDLVDRGSPVLPRTVCPDKPPISPVVPKERVLKNLSLNLNNFNASPTKDVPPSPTFLKSSPMSSPMRDLPQPRSPLREIYPFRLDSLKGSPPPDSILPGKSPEKTPSPTTSKKDMDFFSDNSPIKEDCFTVEASSLLKTKEIPSPVIPKDLVLTNEMVAPSKIKESVFTKEVPPPITPKDVFLMNTLSSTNNEPKINKSSSFTEIKKEVPVPAPRTSLRKDNSLPTMPEFMRIHLVTTDITRGSPLRKDSGSNNSCVINVGSKKSVSSSCESLDTHDQVQSSSFSDSCDSMDNVDQWRNHKNNENQWRSSNRYSEISSSDSDDKQLSITPDSSDIEKKLDEEEISIVQLRRKSFAKDWSQDSLSSAPRPLRQKSLEPELLGQKKDVTNTNLNEVILRRKSLSKEIIKADSDEPELLKVFARRSLKIPKDFDVNDNTIEFSDLKVVSKDSDKENDLEEVRDKEKMPGDTVKFSKKSGYESFINNNINNTVNEDKKSPQKEVIKPFRSIKPDNIQKSMNDNEKPKVAEKQLIEETKPIVSTSELVDNINEKNINKVTEAITDNVPRFKKIQQRREEWEQRMQQARKT